MSGVAYNPMTGTRLDLVVEAEDGDVADRRWRAARRVYLEELVQQPGLSKTTLDWYVRELVELRK